MKSRRPINLLEKEYREACEEGLDRNIFLQELYKYEMGVKPNVKKWIYDSIVRPFSAMERLFGGTR